MKKIVIAGGTGFLGKSLIHFYEKEAEEIVVLSRDKKENNGKVKHVQWDGKTYGDWAIELEGAEVVINLCGKSVDCRYTEKNKALIFSSRLDSTNALGKAIQKVSHPPKVWINAASATIYKHSETQAMTEAAGELGSGFSVEVCKAWEKTFNEIETKNTRKIIFRVAMVLGNTGGVLPVLNKLTKKGLGGTMGNGSQRVSWVHVSDFCAMIDWALKNQSVNGTYNCSAPEPITNKKLMHLLREKNKVKFGMPAKKWMLEIGAFILRTETELILKSRYVVPEKVIQQGFEFTYPTIEKCFDNLFE